MAIKDELDIISKACGPAIFREEGVFVSQALAAVREFCNMPVAYVDMDQSAINDYSGDRPVRVISQ